MRIYVGQASKRHYWNEENSREVRNQSEQREWTRQSLVQGEKDSYRKTTQNVEGSVERAVKNLVYPDTQISKFYRKYGEDYMERFYRNQEAEI